MPSNQLLIKSIWFPSIPVFLATRPIKHFRFNLPRGKIARVLGFNVAWIIQLADVNEVHALDVITSRTKTMPERAPPSALWSNLAQFGNAGESSFNLPKPFRCIGLSVQTYCLDSNASSCQLIIYYDIDDISKDEDVPMLETARQKGRRVL